MAWPWQLFRDGGRSVIFWPGRATLELDGDRATATIADPDGQPADGRASIVFFAVTALLRRRGLFTVHAAAVERDGLAVLLLAPSGRGKTTAALSLQQAGWRLLSDDHPIVRERDGGIEVLPFAVPPRVTAATAARFPGLAAVPGRGAKAEVPLGAIGRPGVPVALLLPEIADWPVSRLEPVRRGRALEAVLRLTLGLATADPADAARHFGLIGRLVRETPCLRLLSGRHVERDLPALLDGALGARAA